MTQEEKQILIIDLCARTPYGVNVTNGNGILKLTTKSDITFVVNNSCRPYLRTWKSMTDKEWDEYHKIAATNPWNNQYKAVDWLNRNHIDYRGLIEKGLALEAPKDMYK
jgi:hypothetical protein